MKPLIALNSALLLGLLTSMSLAAEPELPAGAVGDKTQVVFWTDGTQLTADRFKAFEASIKDIVPESERANTHRKMQMFEKIATGFVAAGGQTLVMSSRQAMGSAEAAPAGAAPAKQKSIVMIRLKQGVTPENFSRDMNALVATIEKEFPEEAKESKPPKFDMKDAGGGWAYATGDDVEAPEATPDAAAMVAFREAMEQQKGAAARVGMRITDDQKKQLAEQAVGPFAGVSNAMRSAKTISLGVYPGDNSRLEVQMAFNDDASAAAFKESLDKLMIGMGQFMGLAGGAAPGQADEKQMETLKATLAPFLMTQKGTTLKTSVDVEQVKKIYKLGEEAQKAAPAATPAPAPAPME